jgi:hypothetical protein
LDGNYNHNSNERTLAANLHLVNVGREDRGGEEEGEDQRKSLSAGSADASVLEIYKMADWAPSGNFVVIVTLSRITVKNGMYFREKESFRPGIVRPVSG